MKVRSSGAQVKTP